MKEELIICILAVRARIAGQERKQKKEMNCFGKRFC
jgi:hypothetical protein